MFEILRVFNSVLSNKLINLRVLLDIKIEKEIDSLEDLMKNCLNLQVL
jgi:hypothetical protein